MKIDSSFKPVTPLPNARPQARPAGEQAVAAAQVNLSALSGALQGGEKPPVNTARIQEIKDAITQGKFKINPEAIADRLLDTARDLINSQRRT
jgi:negative regulator of flagellin synthesis FlgM